MPGFGYLFDLCAPTDISSLIEYGRRDSRSNTFSSVSLAHLL